MKTIKIFILILLVIITVSCSVKFVSVPTNENALSVLNNGLSNRIGKNEAFLVFVNDFNKMKVLVLEEAVVKHDTIISNNLEKPNTAAYAVKISKISKLKIVIDSREIKLTPKQMSKYKFIFVYKRRNKFVVEFDNKKSVNELSRTVQEYKEMN